MEMLRSFILLSLVLSVSCLRKNFFSSSLDSEPSLSILYARDKKSDMVTNDCLVEMYPRNLYKYPLNIDRNDIPCIIHCVLKKFGIMSNDGVININNYYRRVQAIHRYDPRILISDVGETCAHNINSMNLDHDVSYFFFMVLLACAKARISVMYAHDKTSDFVAEQCLLEMYPRNKRVDIQESDEACIIFCVLKKLGIMNASGQINLVIYRKVAHKLAQRHIIQDRGGSCVETAEAAQHKQDVCKKAKVFNDCTHLYKMLLK